jgi:hypothetical protein
VSPPAIDQIAAAVAERYGIASRELYREHGNREPYVRARRAFYRLLHDLRGCSWAAVAGVCGVAAGGSVQRSARKADPEALAEILVALHFEQKEGRA